MNFLGILRKEKKKRQEKLKGKKTSWNNFAEHLAPCSARRLSRSALLLKWWAVVAEPEKENMSPQESWIIRIQPFINETGNIFMQAVTKHFKLDRCLNVSEMEQVEEYTAAGGFVPNNMGTPIISKKRLFFTEASGENALKYSFM